MLRFGQGLASGVALYASTRNDTDCVVSGLVLLAFLLAIDLFLQRLA